MDAESIVCTQSALTSLRNGISFSSLMYLLSLSGMEGAARGRSARHVLGKCEGGTARARAVAPRIRRL